MYMYEYEYIYIYIYIYKDWNYIQIQNISICSDNANFVSVQLFAVAQARLDKHIPYFPQSFHKNPGAVLLFKPRPFLPIFPQITIYLSSCN